MSSDPNNENWAELWLNTQKQFWSGYLDPTGHSGPRSAVDSIWEDYLDTCRENLTRQGRTDELRVIENLAGEGAAYLDWAGKTMQGLQEIQEKIEAGEDWQGCWQDYLEQAANDQTARAGESWLDPLWQHHLQSLKDIHPELFQGADIDWSQLNQEAIHQFLKANPLIGQLEEQKIREGIRLWVEYDRVRQQHGRVLNQISTSALQRLKEQLDQRQENPVNSLDELFNLWVECGEATYAEQVATDEYAKTYGELTNSAIVLNQFWRKLCGETLARFGVPEGDEIREIYSRYHQMRRQFRKLQAQMNDLRESTDRQLTQMRTELEELRKGVRTPSAKRTPAKKSTSKRPPRKAKS